MQTPLFSIITVTFNPGKALLETIDSIRNQKFNNYEHIIKDACSNDFSVMRYAQSTNDYYPIVICKCDKGIYDAMNQALDYAKGEYILYLNAGDCFQDENVLEKISNKVLQKKDFGLIYGDYYSKPLSVFVKSPKRFIRFYLYHNTLCHQSCFISRKLIEKVGRFDISLKVLADYDLLLRLVIANDYSYHYEELTVSSCMGGGFSSQPKNVHIALKEAVALRKRYFKKKERYLYFLLRAMTFPSLRIKLMRSTRFIILKRAYIKAVNILNS